MQLFDPESRPAEAWRAKIYEVIFETDTRAGLLFDVVLLVAIVVSIAAISLETVPEIGDEYGGPLTSLEWVLTGVFTLEYVLRLVCVKEWRRYALSFMGVVDLLSLLPTYLGLLLGEAHIINQAQALQSIRALRLLRVFRIFQLGDMLVEGSSLFGALVRARHKVAVFLGTVMIIVVIQGALLYYLEHRVNQDFSSIPQSVYWAIVTLTTVGYGDISPVTPGGQLIASLLMLLGYGIIAVPTGLVSAEVIRTDPMPGAAPPPLDPDQCSAPPPALVFAGPVDERDRPPRARWSVPEPAPAPAPLPDPAPEPAPAPLPDPDPPEDP